MASSQKTSWFKKLSVWMNAAADAWNMGEADWLFGPYRDGPPGSPVGEPNILVVVWCRVYTTTGSVEEATDAVYKACRMHNIDPRRHKVHAR